MRIIVTTPHGGGIQDPNLAEFIRETGFLFIPRERRSLVRICQDYEAEAVVVWQNEGPVLYQGNDKFFFHPSVARTRLGAYRKVGAIDPLVRACQLQPDDSFLDCTMGLGADIIVASYFLPNSEVVGLESSPGIAQVVKWGMKLYQSEFDWLQQAIQRIEVIQAEHLSYLKKLPESSYDIVYFDPMFRSPLLHSAAISPLRSLANHKALEVEVIEEARRVARKRVVVKERQRSMEFSRLGVSEIKGSRHNPIVFGVIEIGQV